MKQQKENGQLFSYLLNGIDVSVEAGTEEILKNAKEQMKRTGINCPTLHFRLYKRSVDARKKTRIRQICTVLVESETPLQEREIERSGLKPLPNVSLGSPMGKDPMAARPMVVGMGPAGLFAAWLLSKNGYRPILIDRGGSVAERVECVKKFSEAGVLDTECNIQFGAGGAGTFSDGKLVTRIHDPLCQTVLQTFADFGAPEDVLTKAKPHVGTDVLRDVIERMLREIETLGGTLLYRCKMEDFNELADKSLQVYTSQGEFHCGALILAIGHSSRDTYVKLLGKQFAMEPKPISVGVRAEHLQKDIDEALYGDFAGHPNLGHAEYALSDTKRERGVYTFCMCPGGEVVAAASEAGGVVVNGMSNHARDGKNANAAVAVSVRPQDYETVDGSRILGAIEFQRKIERSAYRLGGENYFAPAMTLGDFLAGKNGTEPSRILPSYRGGKVRICDISEVFPPFVRESLDYAFHSFGRKIAGYDTPDAVLTAPETRTSAPLRILRNGEDMNALGHENIYPCGEGAGYAGGITSAGVDGLRAALALMKRFAPPEKEERGNA